MVVSDVTAFFSDHIFDNAHFVIVTHVNKHRFASNFRHLSIFKSQTILKLWETTDMMTVSTDFLHYNPLNPHTRAGMGKLGPSRPISCRV